MACIFIVKRKIQILLHGMYLHRTREDTNPFHDMYFHRTTEVQILLHGMYIHRTTEDTNSYSWHVSLLYNGRYKSLSMAWIFIIQRKILIPIHDIYFHRTREDRNPYSWYVSSLYNEDTNPSTWHISSSYNERHKSLFIACIFIVQWKIQIPINGMLFMACIFIVQLRYKSLFMVYLHRTTEVTPPSSWHLSSLYKGRYKFLFIACIFIVKWTIEMFMACIFIVQKKIQILLHGIYLHRTTEETNHYLWHVSLS